MDKRGQISGSSMMMLGGLVALVVAALLTAVLLPVGVDAITGDRSAQYNQSVGETREAGNINITVDSTTSGTDATYTLELNNDSASGTVAVGSNDTFTVDGEDITITTDEAGGDYAVYTIEYPPDSGWSGAAGSLWTILDLIIILGPFLLLIGLGLRARGQV